MFDPATIWVLIPIAAIAAGAFSEWMKFKAKQQKLGSSTEELEGALKQVRAELDRQASLEKRVANLETIVTSQTWDVLLDPTLDEKDKRFLTDADHEVEALKRDLSDADKAERLAKRIR